LRVKVNV
jgi:hypothetical protein